MNAKNALASILFLQLFLTSIVAQSGKVGIGTDSPGSLLHLYNTENTSSGLSMGTPGLLPAQQTYLEFITQGDGTAKLGQPGNIGWQLTARSGAYGGIVQQHDLLLSHWDGSSWKQMMFFDTSGFIGIGTGAPKTKLHIYGGAGSGDPTSDLVDAFIEDEYAYLEFSGDFFGGITFKDDGSSIHSGYFYNYQQDRLELNVGNNTYLSLNEPGNLLLSNNGKFGIGTTPDFPLHVTTNSGLRSGHFYNTTSSASTTIGLYSGAYGSGSGNKRGGSFEAVGGSGENTAVRAIATGGLTNLGLYGSASGGNTNWAGYFDDGNIYMKNRLGIGIATPAFPIHVETSSDLRTGYFYNTLNSAETTYGVWGGAYGGGSGNKRGGGFEAVGGTGENIGMRAYATGGSTNIGVYGTASGGSSNWAGYFTDGNVYVQNNVGIGTSTPGQKLHIDNGDIEINGATPWIYLDNTSTGNCGIFFQNANATKSQVYYNSSQGYLLIGPPSGGNFMVVEESVGVGINTSSPAYDLHVSGNNPSDIAEFYNANTGTNADVIRAKVNTTTPTASQYFFRAVGGDGNSDGGVRADGSGGAFFATTSDRRLKTNIRNFTGALGILNKVQPRQYEMKQNPGFQQYGFIAQELAEVYPAAVAGSENSDVSSEPMMVDYSRLTPLLAGATKELHEMIRDQQSEIDQLKKELAEIKALLEKK